MATRSKSNRGAVAAVLLVASAGLFTIACYPGVSSSITWWGSTDAAYYYEEISEIGTVYGMMLAILGIWAFCLPPFRRLRREAGLIQRIPAEAAIAAIVIVCACQGLSLSLCLQYVRDGWGNSVLLYGLINMLVYLAIYGSWTVAVMVLAQILDMGVERFVRERMMLPRWIKQAYGSGKGMIRAFIDSIKRIDLSDRSDRWLLKLVGANFIILLLCCVMWYWGLVGIIIYSVVLFFLLHRYVERVKQQYRLLLEATREMARGNLQVEITEDLGLFEGLKAELARVNQGFKKAVEEEMKSQNMKTELVTNVSHDLKTPLTAIITYVNLLKDETITPEERRSYVDILDRKSLRLKKLIEDLFEVSKAASGNIQLDKQPVDLCEIVRQAAWEQEDQMKSANLEMRMAVPEERVVLELDGEKTYRVMENLLVNAVKYALPGTRVWLSMAADAETAEITLKNISAMELGEEVDHLTERFIRGDKSRNTEGSGLGLSIVKSFVELQGGSFTIEVDGDLFKAIVRFPL